MAQYTVKYYSAIKKNEIMPSVAIWMTHTEIVILNKVTQKYLCIIYIWNLKRNYAYKLIYKAETDSQILRRNSWLPRESVGRKDS